MFSAGAQLRNRIAMALSTDGHALHVQEGPMAVHNDIHRDFGLRYMLKPNGRYDMESLTFAGVEVRQHFTREAVMYFFRLS